MNAASYSFPAALPLDDSEYPPGRREVTPPFETCGRAAGTSDISDEEGSRRRDVRGHRARARGPLAVATDVESGDAVDDRDGDHLAEGTTHRDGTSRRHPAGTGLAVGGAALLVMGLAGLL